MKTCTQCARPLEDLNIIRPGEICPSCKAERNFWRKRWALRIVLVSVILLVVIHMWGCTTPHTAKELDDVGLETKGHSTYGEIGINEKGQAVVQVKQSAEVELRAQEMANYYFAEQLRDQAWHLHECRVQMANPENGGSGETSPIPSVDGMKPASAIKEEMGLVDDHLVVVTKEFLDDRLKAERKFQTELERMIQVLKPMREECERKLGYVVAQQRRR